jgi:hypothetical protein
MVEPTQRAAEDIAARLHGHLPGVAIDVQPL